MKWAELGVIDYVFPMTYTSSASFAKRRAMSHVALLRGSKARLWEGLSITTSERTLHNGVERRDPERLIEQIRTVIGQGAEGVTLFQYRDLGRAEEEAITRLSSEYRD